MKKLVLRMITFLIIGALLSSTIAVAECSHEWKLEYDPMYHYRCVDETYHEVSGITLYYVCKICSQTKVEEQSGDGTRSKHSFAGDTCYSCGYEMGQEEHEHQWKLWYDPEYIYEPYNDEYHELIKIKLYYKCNCGEMKTEIQSGDGEKSRHIFKGDICETCGYASEEEEHQHQWDFQYSPEYVYQTYNVEYHTLVETRLYYVCKQCGETKIEVQNGDGQLFKHSFSNHICLECGFEEVVATPTSTVAPTATPVATPEPTIAPTATPVATPEPTIAPTATLVVTPEPTIAPTVTPEPTIAPTATLVVTPKPTIAPTVTPEPTMAPTTTPVVTSEPTSAPAEHICVFPQQHQFWVGAYRKYNKELHTQQRVTFAYCLECGEKTIFSNITEYVPHTLVDMVCIYCGEKTGCTDSERTIIEEQLSGLNQLLVILETNKISQKVKIDESTYKRYVDIINGLIGRYRAAFQGDELVDNIPRWERDNDLLLLSKINDDAYLDSKRIKVVFDYFEKNSHVLTIQLDKPDNQWYYFVNDVGQQVILGNFSEKVTIVGTIGEILTGELPIVGTVADVRDVVADFKNWEWTWQHVGITSLDFVGLIPIVGALKYSDELGKVTARGVKLSDEAGEVLTGLVKHSDEIADAAKRSDEVSEAVSTALLKHADEVGDVAQTGIKHFDELVSSVKHPEIFRNGALEHIFLGNASGGFHFEGIAEASGKVVQVTKKADAHGVYEAMVEIGGKVKRTPSTFFPKDWSAEQVLEAIEEAYGKMGTVPTRRNLFDVVLSSGITIELAIDIDTFKIVSAYPIIP